ncbi:MAG: translation initiation factor IF-2 [Nitrospiraceae bacterium]
MRVYEIAKKAGVESKDVLAELKRLGVTVASHSSTLESDVAERVLARLQAGSARTDKEVGKDAGPGRSDVEGGGSVAKSGPGRTVSAAVEEPAKPDKRRILIKKKKSEDEPGPVDMAPIAAEPQLPPMTPVVEPPPVVVAEAPVVEAVVEPPAPAPPPVVESPAPVPPTPPVEVPVGTILAAGLTLHTQAVIPPTPSAKPSTPGSMMSQADLAAALKKKGVMGPDLGEKGRGAAAKKVRKPGAREREGEDARVHEDATRWGDLRAISVHRRDDRSRHTGATPVTEITKPRKKSVKLTAGATVKEFAELVGQRPADVMRKLMEAGQMLTLNMPMNLELATLIGESFGVKVEVAVQKEGDELLEEAAEWTEDEQLETRPPVVTIMGHVDHGKTSLLDAIRQTKVAEGEAGGITQHIGAYSIELHGKRITFLDTPGHEAFTAMRARGAKVTDLVILVVAADDGVMPQTVEAIHHATAAGVPIIVAVNKIDKPEANPDRVKHALAEHNLIPEAWGGQTIMVEVSAKKKQNLDLLLEMILLQADVLELKADPRRPAKGTVIEAKLDRGRGPVATVLVQDGTLHIGDAYVVGTFSGRVRAFLPALGHKLKEAGPSTAVEVIGLSGVPSAGDTFMAVKDERVAREIAETRLQKQRAADLAGPAKVSLDDLYARIKQGDMKELAVVIKSDVQGSSEALAAAVEKLPSEVVRLRVIHKGVGGITETDVLLAAASKAIVIGFNVRPEPKAASLAEQEGVDLRLYSVIYDAIADIRNAMEGLLEPTFKERTLGRAEVRQVFNVSKAGVIAGCYVVDGSMTRACSGVRVVRDSVTVYEGKLGSLRRFKDDVREVQQGYECGIGVENFSDIKAGDVIENFVLDRVAVKL